MDGFIRVVHIFHLGKDGVVTGTDEQRLTASAAPSLHEGDIVVSEEMYDLVTEGLDRGMQYRYVHGDLVCDGENVEALKRAVRKHVHDVFREVTTNVTVTHGKETFTVRVQEMDMPMLQFATHFNETVAIMSSDEVLLLLSPEEAEATARRVLAVRNIARFACASVDIHLEEAKTSKEVNAIRQRALQQMREESWT